MNPDNTIDIGDTKEKMTFSMISSKKKKKY